jgi:hypothetical protein
MQNGGGERMNASVKSPFDTEFDPQVDDSVTRLALGSVGMAARAGVVNRTHRVIRQRAKVMQARRSRARGLLLPMIICSAFLLLIVFAMWSGLYQNPVIAETLETDVAALAAMDASNHYMVALLWFVPACLAVLATALYRRTREGGNDKAGR